MRKIKNRRKLKKFVTGVMDVASYAFEAGLPVPKTLTNIKELTVDFPHLTMLFALHKDKTKSSFLIHRSAKLLRKFSEEEIRTLSQEDWERAYEDAYSPKENS